MNPKHFFRLIRYKNLGMLIFIQVLFSVVIAHSQNERVSMPVLLLLVQTTVFLAAAGNVINDFFDVKADVINKPNQVIVGKYISKKQTLFIYFLLNGFGVFSGIILAYLTHKMTYGLLFIVISALLYLYSKSLKKIALLGNFIISCFIALSILLILIFPPFEYLETSRTILMLYAMFAFLLNFIREIVKDIEDIKGDYQQDIKSLPILIGRKRTHLFLYIFSFIPFLLIIVMMSVSESLWVQMYFTILIIMPLGYFMYQIKDKQSQKEISKLSQILKLIMLLGIVSILVVI